MLRLRTFSLLLLVIPAVACQKIGPVGGSAKSPFIEGRAEVMDVNNELGTAVLKIDGKPVNAYWDTEPRSADQTDNPIPSSGFDAPIVHVKEPTVRQQLFPAQVGDTIGYRGMMTGHELLLRGVAVLPK